MNICSRRFYEQHINWFEAKNTLPIDIYAGDVDLLNPSYIHFTPIKAPSKNDNTNINN